MAGVDHAYQYSVEVKSRFSLFLDDTLNNEDPDLLISKLKTERTERQKKEKLTRGDPEPEDSLKTDVSVNGNKPTGQTSDGVRLPKPQVVPNEVVASPEKSPSGDQVPLQRGRGAPRGFGRSRGRGQGARSVQEDSADSTGDFSSRGAPFEPRGRGRGRARGGMTRGRGFAYTDYRESDRSQSDMTDQRRRREEPNEVAFADDVAPPETEVVAPAVEHQDGTGEEAVKEDVDATEEEEPKSYTLEEYKALRSQAKPAFTLNSKHSRKANDGKDVFANMVALRKLSEESDEDTIEVQLEPEDHRAVEIDFTFTDRRNERARGRGFNRGGFDRGRGMSGFRGEGRPRAPRGARGGFRGDGRGRGFTRGTSNDQHVAAPPMLHSDQDFPSLK